MSRQLAEGRFELRQEALLLLPHMALAAEPGCIHSLQQHRQGYAAG